MTTALQHWKYNVILFACIAIYFGGSVNNAEGGWFYVFQSLPSSILIVIVLSIQVNNLTIAISSIELSAIALNLLACIGYLSKYEFFYTNYSVMLNSLCIAEVIALLFGAPWNDGNKRIRRLWQYLIKHLFSGNISFVHKRQSKAGYQP